MKRRDVLKRAAALGATGALAGCVSGTDGTSGGGDGDGGGASGGETTTTPVTPSVTDTQFLGSSASCGQGNEAAVEFEGGSTAVRITGTLGAPDPCHNPSFAETSYDADSDELRVTVTAVEDPSAEMCTQCLAKVEYEALVRFDGALPGSVSVTHMSMSGSETVATASR